MSEANDPFGNIRELTSGRYQARYYHLGKQVPAETTFATMSLQAARSTHGLQHAGLGLAPWARCSRSAVVGAVIGAAAPCGEAVANALIRITFNQCGSTRRPIDTD